MTSKSLISAGLNKSLHVFVGGQKEERKLERENHESALCIVAHWDARSGHPKSHFSWRNHGVAGDICLGEVNEWTATSKISRSVVIQWIRKYQSVSRSWRNVLTAAVCEVSADMKAKLGLVPCVSMRDLQLVKASNLWNLLEPNS